MTNHKGSTQWLRHALLCHQMPVAHTGRDTQNKSCCIITRMCAFGSEHDKKKSRSMVTLGNGRLAHLGGATWINLQTGGAGVLTHVIRCPGVLPFSGSQNITEFLQIVVLDKESTVKIKSDLYSRRKSLNWGLQLLYLVTSNWPVQELPQLS